MISVASGPAYLRRQSARSAAGDPGDELLDVAAAAAHLGTGQRMVRRLVAQRRVEVQHVGRHVRIRRSALDAWLSGQVKAAMDPGPPPRPRPAGRTLDPVAVGGKRTRSFGAIDRRPTGSWRARYRGPDGQRHSQSFERKADAEAWLASQQTDQKRGAWLDPRAGRVTFEQYATAWLENRPKLSARTREDYGDILEDHLVPRFGRLELAQVTPSSVRNWFERLAGTYPARAAKAYRLLRAILNTAVADERILRNPCRVDGGGTENSPERPTATLADVDALVAAMPEQLRLAVLLATWTQLRRGEILGLRRRDVDLMHGTLTVTKTRQRLGDGTEVLGPPKSRAGARTIAVPPHVIPVLRDHLDRFAGAGPNAHLFIGARSGEPLHPSSLKKAWTRARDVTGLTHLHMHDMRHTGNTWAAATGASTKELMARMGHSSPAAALRYQHATEERDHVLAQALSGLAKQAKVTPIGKARSRRSI